MKKLAAGIACLLLLHAAGYSQNPDQLKAFSKSKTPEALQELRSFLAIPNEGVRDELRRCQGLNGFLLSPRDKERKIDTIEIKSTSVYKKANEDS